MRGNWKRIPMGDLCTITSGKSNAQDAVDDGLYMFFDRSKTPKRSSRYLYDQDALIIPGEGTEFIPRHFVGKFDLHQRAYALFDFDSSIDVRYLYFFLIYFKDWFVREAVGATVKSLRRRHFTELPVEVPPVPEQKRIVAILDEAFAGIDAAIANTEKNLANARELFESYLNRVFTEKGEDWETATIADVCRVVNGGTPKTKVSDYWGGEHQWITPAEMGGRTSPYVSATKRTLTEAGLRNSSARLLPTDSLILSCRAPIGYVAINSEPMAFNQGCKGLVPGDPLVTKYLYHYLTSVVDLLNDLGVGTTFKELSGSKLKTVPVPVPPLHKQKRIVAILDEVASQTRSLESTDTRKLAVLAELKQSILQKAFAGELTAEVAEKEVAAA